MEKIITKNGIEFIDDTQNLSYGDYLLNFEKQYLINKTNGFVFSPQEGYIGRILQSNTIPSKYAIADNVQIPTTGYINTGVSAITASTRSKFKVTWQGSATGNRGLYGVRSSTSVGANSYNVFLTVSAEGPRWDCIRSSTTFSSWQVGETHEVEITHTPEGYGQVIDNGEVVATGTLELGTDILDFIHLNTFYTVSSGSTITGGTMRWHYCQIWGNGTALSADFVPVFDTVENVAGLYDKFRKQFFGNDGTGVITAYDAQGNLIGPTG